MAKRVSTADFIERAKAVHGDRYDYSLVEYRGNHKHVTIVCKDHGQFPQSPANHYSGKGCQVCGGSKPHTTESFIQAAQKIHGEWYDYSQIEYTMNKAHVMIVCPDHGSFSQVAAVHLRGNGCPECGGCKRHDTESFIEKAQTVHGDFYDYSLVKYLSSHEDVKIICPKHGEFMQSPTNHLHGKGCYKCGRLAASDAKRSTTEEFIVKAKVIHGDRYGYALVEYVGNAIKVKIICSKHGTFEQTPSEHLVGSGCNKCGIDVRAEIRRKTTEQFIASSHEVHGDRYDYSLVDYLGAQEKVTIICPKHGPFEQSPNGHRSGKGCSDCAEYGFNPNKPALLYYVAISTDNGETLYKIGITNLSVEYRYQGVDLSRVRVIKSWYFDKGLEARQRESEILNQFKVDRYNGPLILVRGGNTELFTHDVLGLDKGEHSESVVDADANLISRLFQRSFDF